MSDQHAEDIDLGPEAQHATTHEAVVAVMRDIDQIAKGRKAHQSQGGYAFRGIEELLGAVGPAFRRHGVTSATEVIGDPIISTYTTSGGAVMNWIMLKVQVTLRGNPDDPTDVLVASHWGEAGDVADKAGSKAYSVGYREALFKALAVPTHGDDGDTERSADIGRASAEEMEAQANAARLEKIKERGWESEDELDAAWLDLKDAAKGESESAVWLRGWMSAQSMNKGKFTATLDHEAEVILSNAKQDGNWRSGFTPPPAESEVN